MGSPPARTARICLVFLKPLVEARGFVVSAPVEWPTRTRTHAIIAIWQTGASNSGTNLKVTARAFVSLPRPLVARRHNSV